MKEDPKKKKIWFPTKRYGWGWGPPVCWQGWAVLLGYIGLVYAGGFFFGNHTVRYLLYVAALTGLLIRICLRKGEKPRWRWGK